MTDNTNRYYHGSYMTTKTFINGISRYGENFHGEDLPIYQIQLLSQSRPLELKYPPNVM